MESDPTNEILCTSCGRPNLKEAVKCWYCQNVLEKPAEEKNNEISNESQQTIPDKQAAKNLDQVQNEEDIDIPDWLKRIRELKKVEQQAQEEKDKWQQQVLFGTSESKKRSHSHKKESTHQAQKKPEITTESTDKLSKPNLQEEKPPLLKTESKIQPEVEDDGVEPGSDELPEGFVRFKPESD